MKFMFIILCSFYLLTTGIPSEDKQRNDTTPEHCEMEIDQPDPSELTDCEAMSDDDSDVEERSPDFVYDQETEEELTTETETDTDRENLSKR